MGVKNISVDSDAAIETSKLEGGGADIAYGSVFGNTFWVDSGHTLASDKSGGGTKAEPFATINFAISQCTVSNGDVILVAPGHAEVITAAGGITLDVIGVTIRGRGNGSLRPKVTFTTATTATFLWTADNCRVENIWFECDKAGNDLNYMLHIVGASYGVIDRCVFVEGASTEQALSSITFITTASNFFKILNSSFYSETANATNAIEINVIQSGTEIGNCDVTGDYSAACIDSDKVHTNCNIHHCHLTNNNTGNHSIEFSDAATGRLAWNTYDNDMTQATGVDPGSCKSYECYHCDVIDKSGILCPAVT